MKNKDLKIACNNLNLGTPWFCCGKYISVIYKMYGNIFTLWQLVNIIVKVLKGSLIELDAAV